MFRGALLKAARLREQQSKVGGGEQFWEFFLIDRTTFFEDIEQLSFDTLFGEYFKAIPLRLSYDI